MTPYEHYMKSEELLEEAETTTNSWEIETKIAKAHVHALLANITADTPTGSGYGESGYGQ